MENNSVQRLQREIYEVNGLKTFFKIKADAFEIGKVLFSFVEFDKATNKLLRNLDVYVDVADMLLFCNDVLSGKLPKQAAEAAKQNEKFPPAVFQSLGGVDAETAAKRFGRTDGKAYARALEFSASSRAGNFAFQAKAGPGHKTEQGLIAMDGQPEIRIVVPCSAKDLKKLALVFKAEYEAYLTGRYARREFNVDIPVKV